MKTNQKKAEQPLQIPLAIQQRCGFTDAETLAVTATDGVCIIHKGELTALELIHVITTLSELASDMTIHLAKACGLCNNCGDEKPETGAECVCDNNPAEWLANCSLCRDLLDESQSIYIPDLPPCILSVLAQSGICLAALDELIMQESTIYGK